MNKYKENYQDQNNKVKWSCNVVTKKKKKKNQ